MSIIGHSDIVGTNTEQVARSNLQAQSLATYVWSHGINIERIELFGTGSHDTIASLKSVNGNGYNRRVEIFFWRKGKPSPLAAFTVGKGLDCWTKADMSSCC
jgi:OmpA-OmpF porin, OOP family